MMLENIADPSCKLNDPRVRIVWSYIAQYAALAKNDSKFYVYKIQVKKEALLAIQSNFKQGIEYFCKLDPHPFTGAYKLDE